MNAVYPQRQSKVIKVHVTGLYDGFVEGDGAVTGTFPVAEFTRVAGQGVEPRAVGAGMMGGYSCFQSRQSDKRFYGGAGRILAAQGTVKQRLLLVVTQGGIVIILNTVHKRIRVIGWQADKGKDVAIVRINGNHRAGVVSKGLFSGGLHPRINGQVKVAPGHWRGAAQYADNTALCRGFHVLESYRAMQHRLIGFFDAGLADMRCTAVIGTVQHLQRPFVNASHVTHCMHGKRTLRVVTGQSGGDVDPGETVPVDGETRNFHIAQMETQRDGFKAGLPC